MSGLENVLIDTGLFHKEVFVKHEKAPTAPDSKGYWLCRICPCFGKSKLLGFLANIRWPKLSKGTSTRQDISYDMSLFAGRYDHPLQRNSLEKFMFRKKLLFLDILAKLAYSAGRIWPKLTKGTSTRQDHSYDPIPRSLRPSVTKNQPGKAHVTKNR